MGGPVTTADTGTAVEPSQAPAAALEITQSRNGQVGAFPVRRALPRRARRTVGAWCFIDHMGPAAIDEQHGLDVAPHPHIGLQTVTWLIEGEAVHRDSGPRALVGGVPFDEPVLMLWNFVARSRNEITAAHGDWTASSERFGHVDSALPRLDVGAPHLAVHEGIQ